MSKRTVKKNSKMERMIQNAVKVAMLEGFASVLHDVEYRITALADAALGVKSGIRTKVNSNELNLAQPILDGFTFTDNSPSAGYVAWTGCSMVYKGTTYTITDGNTNKKYIYWQFSGTKTAFATSDTIPTLTDDDCLIAVNTSGVHSMNIGDGRVTHGATIMSGTVGGTQIGTGAVGTTNIANSAITNTLLASGAVGSGNLASGAVNSSALAAGAVGNAALAANAVQASNIASGAVGSTQLAANAVTSTAIASGAVGSSALASGAVTSSAIASGAVGSAAIAAGSVGSSQIASGAVGSTQIGAGAVASNNLNLAQHLLY